MIRGNLFFPIINKNKYKILKVFFLKINIIRKKVYAIELNLKAETRSCLSYDYGYIKIPHEF